MLSRLLTPELLDHLPPGAPAAIASRADLRRLNRLLRSPSILTRALRSLPPPVSTQATPLYELGAGDGWLALQLAQRLGPSWRGTNLHLIDKSTVVADGVDHALTALGWHLKHLATDVLSWAETSPPRSGMVLANLFLHHLEDAALTRLFTALARSGITACIALEPRRSPLALLASRLVGLIGCNAVTRHDAFCSVQAGFRQQELSHLWPDRSGWLLQEGRAGLLSHLFIASRSHIP